MTGKQETHGNKYRKVNDYDIKKLSIQSESGQDMDMRFMFTQLHVYEDIYTNNISGVIIVRDGLNLLSNLPINGRERISFSFITPGHDDKEPVSKTCTVYKIDEFVRSKGQRTQAYKLFFTSDEKFVNENTKVSKSYTGKISEMVAEILGEFVPSAEVKTLQQTSEKHRFIMPNWSPFKCINWLCGRAESSQKTTQANYLFYEDADGYHFTDLGYLYTLEPVAKYTYNPTTGHQVYGAEGQSFGSLATAFYTANTFTVQQASDTLRWLDTGLYSSTLHTHDITKKKFEVETYDYDKEFDSTEHIYGNKLISSKDALRNSFDAKVHFQPKQDKQYTSGADPDNLKYENWFLHRKSQMVQTEGQKITIEVPGNHSLRPGNLIEFEYADTKELTRESGEYLEKTFSGIYMISAIHHMMEAEHYRCSLELIRDSRYEPLPESSQIISPFRGGGGPGAFN
tara:strand:+ start:11154 stop:12518 length:1365 start_codon:yes stop_codon:yes gene_type:complete